MLTDGAYALLAGSLAPWLGGNSRFLRIQRRVSGGVLVTLGVTMALRSGRK
jgi:threonine/homoserine/homoserine lactone efflux protein